MKRVWMLPVVVLSLLLAAGYLNAAKIYNSGGVGGGVAGWPGDSSTKEVTWANSLVNALCVGDGTNPLCLYTDSTLGSLIRPRTDSNTRAYAWTNFNWSLYDVEGSKEVAILDPDAFGTGSGTLTLQTSEQLVASNFGVELNESDTNPACAAGNYTIFADTSDATMKGCNNGVVLPFEKLLYKSADEQVTSSVALQNDDVFVIPVVANATYAFHMHLRYSAATTGDIKYVFTLPASAVGEKNSAHAPIGATACSNTSTTMISNDITQTDANVGGVGTGAGNICSLVIDGVVVVAGTAGNVTLQWAQVASDATATTVHAGSYATYRRIN